MKGPTEASTLRYHHTYQKAIGNQESTGKRRSDDDPRIPDAAPAHGRARVISTEANTEIVPGPRPRVSGVRHNFFRSSARSMPNGGVAPVATGRCSNPPRFLFPGDAVKLATKILLPPVGPRVGPHPGRSKLESKGALAMAKYPARLGLSLA